MQLISEERFNSVVGKFTSLEPILVVGDVGVDKYTFGEVNRISPEAPVTILEVDRIWHKLGLAANVSDNLKSLGVQSTLCGITGSDFNADLLENLLEEKGLKTWGVIRAPGRQTTLKERVTTKIQQICRIDYETKDAISVDHEKRVIKRVEEFLEGHGALIIEDYGKGLISETVCGALIPLFRQAGKKVLIDPSRHTPPRYYQGATLLKPNHVECQLLVKALGYKDSSINKMAEILVNELNLEMIVITLGAEGMALMDRQHGSELIVIPTVANEVYDVSGAGDTTISAISSALLAGASLVEAAWIGNCAAGVVVGKKGTATVNLEELSHFYKGRLAKLNV